jgi:hypothetical protein
MVSSALRRVHKFGQLGNIFVIQHYCCSETSPVLSSARWHLPDQLAVSTFVMAFLTVTG